MEAQKPEVELTPEQIRYNAIPTAAEVLQLTKDAQVNSLLNAINTAVNNHLYSMRYEHDLTEENQKILADKGFKLTKKTTNAGYQWEINWEA